MTLEEEYVLWCPDGRPEFVCGKTRSQKDRHFILSYFTVFTLSGPRTGEEYLPGNEDKRRGGGPVRRGGIRSRIWVWRDGE